jgi:hypothetical protein
MPMLSLLRLKRGEEARARTEQAPRALAFERLDLDHLGAEIGQHHPAGRAHHHVRELDHAQTGQGLRRCGHSRRRRGRFGRGLRGGIGGVHGGQG